MFLHQRKTKWNNKIMNDAHVKITVAIISLLGTLLGCIIGYVGRTKKQAVDEAKREQMQTDNFSKLFDEMNDIKKRLDIHNKYAEKFGEIEISLASIKKDIEYIRKDIK